MRRAIAARVRAEGGFALVTVIVVLFTVTLVSVAALSAAQGDLVPGQHDKDRKEALAAAEAGLQTYLFDLVQDPGYWTKCDTGAQPQAVNQVWDGSGADPRRWLSLPGSRERYTIELLPANGAAQCSVAAPEATMIDTATGSFRIRATGQDRPGGVKRSLIANLRRRGFLDFIYFTDKETRDPDLYSIDTGGLATKENPRATGLVQRDVTQWGREECGTRYWGSTRSDGHRGDQQFVGDHSNTGILINGVWNDFSLACTEIQFAPGDTINGPFHTNDEINVCGSPKFGRSPADNVEVSGPGRAPSSDADSATMGWRASCAGGVPAVNFKTTSPVNQSLGTWVPSAPILSLPPTNSALKNDTASADRFKGRTTIVLNGTTMTVSGKRDDGSNTVLTNASLPIPSDGVVYVSDDSGAGCGQTYNPIDAYNVPSGCGNLEIQGTYARNVTFGAQNDILIRNDVTRDPSADVLLGLISNNYIRVYHPVTAKPVRNSSGVLTCTNVSSGGLGDVSIDAAILSLQHSFIVDYYYCGNPLGTLSVTGAIAQAYRGPVGKGNTTIADGYLKNYTYDNRLKFRSPPDFLDPVQAAWRIQTYAEQVPAR